MKIVKYEKTGIVVTHKRRTIKGEKPETTTEIKRAVQEETGRRYSIWSEEHQKYFKNAYPYDIPGAEPATT